MNRIVEGSLKCSFGKMAFRHTNPGSDLPKVLMCHGWQDHLDVFKKGLQVFEWKTRYFSPRALKSTLVRPLSKHLDNFELFAFDYPGHGKSDHVTWPWNYGHSEQLKIIHEIKHKLNWSEMSIVAHSWAGNSLTPYVCMYPDQVTHYIMLDAYGKRIFEYFESIYFSCDIQG